MSPHTKDICESFTFFAFVAITALCLCFTFSIVMYSLGVPDDPENFIRANLFISGCVAIPTAALAAQHEFRMRLYQRKLESIASTDALTGLLNRKFFKQFAVEELLRMHRTQTASAIAIFDVDHFKKINDNYGHAAGDRVLKEIAEVAYSELRGPFDRLGRWGGEEFVMLLSGVTPEQASLVCDRVRSRIEEHIVFDQGDEIRVTASFGVCMMMPGADFDKKFAKADAALYASKTNGRNRVTMADILQLAA